MIPPITAATVMSAAYSSYSPRRRNSIAISQPPMRKPTIIMIP